MAKKFSILILLLVAAGKHACGNDVTEATVCQILADPVSFNGKMVKVRGRVVTGFEFFELQGQGCGGESINAITLAYADESDITPAPSFKLQRDAEFAKFERSLTEKVRKSGPLSYCYRYEVTATITGRLDGVEKAGIIRDGSGKVVAVQGFGHANRYRARLVIQSVSQVVAKDISAACRQTAQLDAKIPGCVLLTATNEQPLTVRGKVVSTSHDMLLAVRGCEDRVVLVYAGDPETGVPGEKLRRDRNFKRFEKYTRATYKGTAKEICLQCSKYEIEATFAGRFDIATIPEGLKRDNLGFLHDETGKIVGKAGFGHPAPAYKYRLVIESVFDVVARKLPDPRSAPAQK